MERYIFRLINDYSDNHTLTVEAFTIEQAQAWADRYAANHGYYRAQYTYNLK